MIRFHLQLDACCEFTAHKLLYMYVCMHVCTYVCTYAHTSEYVHTYMSVPTYVHTCVYVYVCMYVCMSVCKTIYIHIQINIYTYITSGAHEKIRGKERATLTQLAKARHLAVLLFLDSLFATIIANVTANSTTVSMASTPVHNLLKTAVKRKI